jgi:hypothetical protein
MTLNGDHPQTPDWSRLGDRLALARVRAGYPSRADVVRASGFKPGLVKQAEVGPWPGPRTKRPTALYRALADFYGTPT